MFEMKDQFQPNVVVQLGLSLENVEKDQLYKNN